MRVVVSLCIAALFLCLPALASAQAAPPPPPPKHEGTGEFTYVGVTGNSSSQTIGLSYDTTARPGSWTFRHKVSFINDESDGALSARSFLYLGRGEKTLSTRMSVYGQYEYFDDEFAGLANRNTVAGGLKSKLVAQARQEFSIDAGLGYLNEDRLSGDDVSSGIYTLGTKYTLKISDTADLSDDFGFVGTFQQADDWRLAHTIAVTARLTGIFSLKVSNEIRFMNFPVPTFTKTDTITKVSFVVKYARQ